LRRRREQREQVDARAVRVVDRRVPHSPERVERRQLTVVSGGGELLIGGVDRGGIGQREGQAHPATTRTRLPRGMETRDRLLGVERQPQPTRETDVDVRLRVGTCRDLQAQQR
jgi:hypothetical protein